MAAAGVHKALLIGITYPGSESPLPGTVNDCALIYALLMNNGYLPENIVFLRDDEDGGQDEEFMPTRANILKYTDWLVSNNRKGDKLFFHYSGHGSTTEDDSGTEADGMMELLCPCDGEFITDDEMNEALVSKVDEGVTLWCLIDACHSGTVLDLPYMTYCGEGGEICWQQIEDEDEKGCKGIVVQFSGCEDSQVSVGTGMAGLATRFFYNAVTVMLDNADEPMTYGCVLKHMQESAKEDFKQDQEELMANMTPAERSRHRAEMLADQMQEKLHAGVFGKKAAAHAAKKGRSFSSNCQTPQISASFEFKLDTPFCL